MTLLIFSPFRRTCLCLREKMCADEGVRPLALTATTAVVSPSSSPSPSLFRPPLRIPRSLRSDVGQGWWLFSSGRQLQQGLVLTRAPTFG